MDENNNIQDYANSPEIRSSHRHLGFQPIFNLLFGKLTKLPPTTTNFREFVKALLHNATSIFLGFLAAPVAAPYLVLNSLKTKLDARFTNSVGILYPLETLFVSSNRIFMEQVALQERRDSRALLKLVVTLSAIVFGFPYQQSMYWLTFCFHRLENWHLVSFFLLVAYSLVMDYIAKYYTIFLKVLVLQFPDQLLQRNSKGKIYHFLETASQLIRTLLPIHPWLLFLAKVFYSNWWATRLFGDLVLGTYLVIKARRDAPTALKQCKFAFRALCKLSEQTGAEDLPFNENCPVCRESNENLARLDCRHVVCRKCALEWFFVRESKTCPLCRARVTWVDNRYSDGTTLGNKICM